MGPLKLLRHLVVILLLLIFFNRKGKAKIFLLQQHFPIYKKEKKEGTPGNAEGVGRHFSAPP